MKFSTLILSLLILIVAGTVNAQFNQNFGNAKITSFDYDFAGGGARAEGMGKAYIGLSNSINGISWNPAGIWEQDVPMLGITWGSNKPRGNTSTNFLNTLESTDLNHTGNINGISAFNFLSPIRIKGHKVVTSVSYSRSFDEYSSYFSSVELPLPVGAFTYSFSGFQAILLNSDSSNTAVNQIFNETRGGMDILNFGFGTRLYQKFSFGLSANIYTGMITSLSSSLDSIPNIVSSISFGQSALHVLHIQDIDSIKFTGMNFTLGLKYNGDALSAGLLIRTPLALGTETEQTEISIITVNGLDVDSPPTKLTPKIRPPLTKYELPLMIGAGLAYQATEQLLVALDLEYRGYANTNVKLRDELVFNASGNASEFFTVMSADTVSALNWQNVMIVRLGAEYLKETKFGTIPIRGGFGYVPVPAGDFTSGATTASVTASYNFSFGSGIPWEQINLDFAYTYTKRDRIAPVSNDLFTDVNLLSEYKFKNHHFSLSFTGYF